MRHAYISFSGVSVNDSSSLRSLMKSASKTSSLSFLALTVSGLNGSRLYGDSLSDFGSLYSLCLNDNDLRSLPAKLFDGMPYLKSLGLRNNALELLYINALKELSMLRRFDLDDNLLPWFRRPQFDGLYELRELNAPRNRIYTLGSGVFGDLGQLHSLRLSNNLLSSLGVRDFKGLRALRLLTLADNRIERLEAGIFEVMPKLDTLRLNNNRLMSLAENVFRSTISFGDVTISGNPVVCDCRLGWIARLTDRRRQDFVRNYPDAVTLTTCPDSNVTIEQAAFDAGECPKR